MKEQTLCCETRHAHPDTVKQVRDVMPHEDTLIDLAEFFYAFSDITRTRILLALLEGELCVCDIATILEMTLSAISHQLRVLRSTNLVKARREGKTVFYRLADDHVKSVLALGLEHVNE